ncbi:hypothetical protein NEOLEDRAFT_1129745 [Neolentinus lepideus HHB14362 ss-1]|uniref:Uncharacterized protein n=1 Tax=Neolentinus lepideus HHB14362 ss-1 TaxID=1314782 RepID=A0A165ULG8_9AGAM|nr:hypothetical protein NEOLEDRAFT_1129745 [Neolentinus lepideus HHB14362 ss-1]
MAVRAYLGCYTSIRHGCKHIFLSHRGWNAVSANYTTVRNISMPGILHPNTKDQPASVSNRLTIWSYPENAACGIAYAGYDDPGVTWKASDTVKMQSSHSPRHMR